MKFMNHPVYIMLIFAVAMPINGAIIQRGDVFVGVILSIIQVIWFGTILSDPGKITRRL